MCPAPRGAIHAQNTFTACDVSPSREVRIILRVYIIYYIKSSGARAKRVFFSLVFQGEKKPHHNGSYEHRVPKLKNKKFVCTRYVCVTKHPPPSTALSARDANCSADGFYARTHINEPYLCYCVVCRSKLAEADAETCVFTGPVTQAGPRFCDFQKIKKLIN